MPWVNARGVISAWSGYTPPDELPADRLQRIRQHGWQWVPDAVGLRSEAERRARYQTLWREANADEYIRAQQARTPTTAWIDRFGEEPTRPLTDGEALARGYRQTTIQPGWGPRSRAEVWYRDVLRERLQAELDSNGRPRTAGYLWVDRLGDLHSTLVSDGPAEIRRAAEDAGYRRIYIPNVGTVQRDAVCEAWSRASRTTGREQWMPGAGGVAPTPREVVHSGSWASEENRDAWSSVGEALMDALRAVPRTGHREERGVSYQLTWLIARTFSPEERAALGIANQ